MNKFLLLPFFLMALACTTAKKDLTFSEKIDREEYHQIAKAYKFDNSKWVDRLYDMEVNIKNYEQFKEHGVDLNTSYGRDYKSRSLRADVILVGTINTKREDNSNVKFHTEYDVSVEKIIKKKNWTPADQVRLKVSYGPAGDRYMASIAGTDRYDVGETVLLYLEPIEKTFRAYETRGLADQSSAMSRINADRNDPNIFVPLKKYTFKDKDVYEQTNGLVGSQSTIFKGIKQMTILNQMK